MLTLRDINAFEWTKLVLNPAGTRIVGNLGKTYSETINHGAFVELKVGNMGATHLSKDAIVNAYSHCIREFSSINASREEWSHETILEFNDRLDMFWTAFVAKLNISGIDVVFTNSKIEQAHKLVWTPSIMWLKDKPVIFHGDALNYMDVGVIQF